MKLITILLLIFLSIFIGNSRIGAQVSIGDQSVPDTDAILDLTNGNSLGLLLPHSSSNPNLGTLSAAPEGLLLYYKENFFLKGSGASFNSITPWKSIYTGDDPSNVYFNPTEYTGVGIGLDGSAIKANLHVALGSNPILLIPKEVNTSNTSASFIIGDSDADTHMSIDNDEILVKNSANNNTGTLKLQEGGGTVQVGDPAIAPYTASTNRSTLNVTGEIQQHGFALVPVGGIIMWNGSTAPAGWALCNGQSITFLDGTTGTAPDLSERFIVGAMGENTTNAVSGTAYPIGVGADEGRNSISHTHSVNPDEFTTDDGGSHNHSMGGPSTDGTASSSCWPCGTWNAAGGSHTHTINSSTHSHTFDMPSKTSSGASNTENRPPYYALAFIIKL